MKKVKCPICFNERIVEDNIVMAICNSCQKEMKEEKGDVKKT